MYRFIVAVAALAAALPPLAPAQTEFEPTGADPASHRIFADGGRPGGPSMPQIAMAEMSRYRLGDLVVEHPWSRATAKGARVGGAFLTIRNSGPRDDRLVAVESNAAGRVELHRTVMEDGVMKMRHVEGGIAVPAGGMAELKPGGFHVMLMGLAGPLEEGGHFPVTLTFERAGTVTIDVAVRAAGAMDAGMDHGN